MQSLRVALVVAVTLAAAPACAQNIDMSAIKCGDFVSSKKEEIGNILAWIEGYYTKATSPPILSTEKLVKHAKALSDYCNKNRDHGLITAANAVIKRE